MTAMSALETIGYALFLAYLGAFFALSAAAARRAGRGVWLLGAATRGQKLPALLFRAAFAGSALWPLVRGFVPSAEIGTAWPGLDLPGAGLVAVGGAIAAAAQSQMGPSWRVGTAVGETSPLVASGLFGRSRNPVFVGQIVLFVGLLLMFPDLVQAGLTLAVVVAIVIQVRLEERILTATLGEPYLAYLQRVPRWLRIL